MRENKKFSKRDEKSKNLVRCWVGKKKKPRIVIKTSHVATSSTPTLLPFHSIFNQQKTKEEKRARERECEREMDVEGG